MLIVSLSAQESAGVYDFDFRQVVYPDSPTVTLRKDSPGILRACLTAVQLMRVICTVWQASTTPTGRFIVRLVS